MGSGQQDKPLGKEMQILTLENQVFISMGRVI